MRAAKLLPIMVTLTVGAPAAGAPVAGVQERAPTGQIYGELLPFVGLKGVRVQITGLQGGIFNLPEPVADPEKAATGLSHAEREELAAAVRADVDDALQNGAVPVLSGGGSATEVRPLLALDIHWARVKQDVITIQVRIELMEAARLIKDPARIVWTSSWASTYNSLAARPEDVPAVVRSVTRGQVETFARLYQRAHAGQPGPSSIPQRRDF